MSVRRDARRARPLRVVSDVPYGIASTTLRPVLFAVALSGTTGCYTTLSGVASYRQSPGGGPGVSGAFFQMLYRVLIGQERGPRFGSFAALYGIDETRSLIAKGLAGELAA